MKQLDIRVKEVLDHQGDLNHIELVQGDNVILISLGNTSLDSYRSTYKWDNLSEVINKIRIRRTNERN